MKTFASILVATLIMASLFSCTRYVYLSKTYDPEIIPSKKPGRIVFVNIFNYTSQAYVKEKNEFAYHAGVSKLLEGLSSSFSKDESFIFIPGDTLKKDITPGQLTAYMAKDTVLAICDRYNSDMLLTLDSLTIFIDWTFTVNSDGENKEKEKQYYLHTNFYLSLYSSTGDLVNRSMIEKSIFYVARDALLLIVTFKPSIAKAIETIKPLAFEAGKDYVSKFYPRTVQESREIYGGKVFKESNLYIDLRNWDKATELLDQLARLPDQNVARKARHNLSVVKEISELERR
jgi:hypothetical protein